MAVSIDWGTSIIYVPSGSLTLVQSSPARIYDLNINNFRLTLKDLEDDAEGIGFLKTHTHNTEVTLGGLTFARVVEILDPYTVTFEDGQYAVNLVGANSNIGDKTNVNQVSVRPQNSAGLISTPLIEFASFENVITWDPDNTTSKAVYGTIFPAGTKLQPTRLLSDVKLIGDYRGLNTVNIMGDATVDSGLDFTDFIFEGQSHVNNEAFISASADVAGVVFRQLSISGTLDGGNEINDCIINGLEYVNGLVHASGLKGDIFLSGAADAVFSNCYTTDPYDPPTIDMGESGQNLAMPNYSGLLMISNLLGNNFVGIGLSAGEVVLDSTVVSGTIYISGVGSLFDVSGSAITTGIWNEGVTIINNLVDKANMADAIWDEEIVPEHTASDSAGELLYGAGGGSSPTAIADAVWNATTVDHTGSGTFGEKVTNKLLTFIKWIALKD